ncbi:hypothetical protein OGAPHI_005687 [Ogataea philodendri]|uniref:K Homology domain-containing protein n=1 Tax=Ogataea philodendri TaxID=1378263 RepID=A0A9P8T1Z7_9ASCO|nr:uncharacterized protein OGAPHI_005687 [Ogataea philodendri]KAH3662435.1 hypothetical protein OGAPHI_005687 [Ogataea philodendri]
MPTPAELLAQKHSAFSEEPETPIVSATESSAPSSAPSEPSTQEFDTDEDSAPNGAMKKISIDDETFFPALGVSVGATPGKWGPFLSNGRKSGPITQSSFKPAVKSSTTQLTFIVDAAEQLPVSKNDMFKIISKIKSSYDVKVESTFSAATNKRTFLLSGPASTIQKAKKDLIKQLTKPVKIEFGIPFKLISTVIGSQGRTLKPILESTGVKIDIARTGNNESSDDDDIFGNLSTVVIEGDLDSCKQAQQKIMAIVNEHTQNLTVKVPVSETLKRFVNLELKQQLPLDVEVDLPLEDSKSSALYLSGPRESVLEAKDAANTIINFLGTRIVTEERTVPKSIHQFLDKDKIFSNTGVLVDVPAEDSSTTVVKFIGLKDNIPKAISFGKQLSQDYAIDSLDLARSHGGNYLHAKALTAFFIYTGLFDSLSSKTDVKIKAPTYASLADDTQKSVNLEFVCHKDAKDSLKSVRREIVEMVNKTTPSFVRVVTDIDSFVLDSLDTTVADEKNVKIVPLGKLAGLTNKIILLYQPSDEEFLPSLKETNETLDAVDHSLDNLRTLSQDLSHQVLPMASADQELLAANSLNVILSKYGSSINIKLHQNSEESSADELLVVGYKNEISKVVDELKQAIDEIKNYETASKYNHTIEFPTSQLSRLIGQKGGHLQGLQDQFNIKIDVFKGEDAAVGDKTQVKLTGLKSNVDECEKKLSQLAKKWVDEKTVVLKIEKKYHRKLIGPSGVYVHRLNKKYNVNIKFPFENATGHQDEVVITGPSKGVSKAEEELRELWQYEKDNGFRETLKIPNSILPRLIGKSGEQVKDLSIETGADIKRLREKSNDETAEFEITGTKESIRAAVKKINSIVDRIQNEVTETIEVDTKWHKHLVGPGASKKTEIILNACGPNDEADFRRLLQVPAAGSNSTKIVCQGNRVVVEKIIQQVNKIIFDLENVTSETVSVPKKKHSLIIGPGGTVRRALELEHHVRVNVPKIDQQSDDVVVRGSPQNVEKAKAAIQKLVS